MATQVINLPATGGINQLTGDVTAGPGTGSQASTLAITTTKGDLVVHSSTANSRLAIGSNNQVLTADSTQTLGVKWAAASVTSPAGSNTQIQYNNAGAFGADSALIFNAAGAPKYLQVRALGVNTSATPQTAFEVNGQILCSSTIWNKYPATTTLPGFRSEGKTGSNAVAFTALDARNVDQGPIRIDFTQDDHNSSFDPDIRFETFRTSDGGKLQFSASNSSHSLTTPALTMLPSGRFGFQVVAPEATLHGDSVIITADNPGPLTVSLVAATLGADCSSVSAAQGPGRLDAPGSPSATLSSGTGFISDGSTYVYQFWTYDLTGKFSAPVSQASLDDGNTGDPFTINLIWNPPSQGTAAGYYVSRQINGGTIFYQDIPGNPGFPQFNDNNTQWLSTTPPGPFYDDLVANGASYSFPSVVGVFTTPSGFTYYSPNPQSASFTDDDSNQSYRIQLSSVGPSLVKYVYGSGSVTLSGNTLHLVLPSDFIGDDVITPSVWGFLSNGSTLSQTFDLYIKKDLAGRSAYSAIPSSQSTVDPNDAQYYYFALTWPPVVSNYKVIRESDLALTTSAFAANLDALNQGTWNAASTVTPSSFSSDVAILQSNPTTSSDAAQIVIKGTNDFGHIAFTNSADATLMDLSAGASSCGLDIGSGATGFMSVAGSFRFRWSSTGISFFGSSPQPQQTGGSATAGAIYTSTEQAMLQKAYDCLRTFGFLT